MFCEKCGAKMDDGSKFCDNCGAPAGGTANTPTANTPTANTPFAGQQQPQQQHQQQPQHQQQQQYRPPQSKKPKAGIIALCAVLALALIAGGGFLISQFIDNGTDPFGGNYYTDHPSASELPYEPSPSQAPGADVLGAGYATGLLEDNPADVFEVMKNGNPDAVVLPERFDNSDAYPPPGNQGMQGSCVGWAVAYALKSHQEYIGGGDYDYSGVFSPAYVYNQINGGYDGGSTLIDAMKLIVDEGVCTWVDMPYSDRDYLTQPDASQKAAAAAYRATNYYSLQGINDIKQAIIRHGGVVTGIPVYDNFSEISTSDPVYSEFSGMNAGGHAICLVGYDDSLQAFKFINSWDTDWGDNGYGYVSYDIVCREGHYAYALQTEKKDTYTITFNPDTGVGNMPPITAAAGQSVTLPPNAFTNGSASFRGWYVYSTGIAGWLYEVNGQLQYFENGSQPESAMRTIIPDEATVTGIEAAVNDTIILTAVWDFEFSYTVSFDSNGGEGFMSYKTVSIDSKWYIPHSQFTHNGDRFYYWYVYSTTLDAWLCYSHDGFEYDPVTELFSPLNYKEFYLTKSEADALEAETPATENGQSGYVLFTQGELVETPLTLVNGDCVILYAQWLEVPQHTIIFNANGGTGHMEPILEWVTMPFYIPQCDFTNDGKTFAGWAVYFGSQNGYLIYAPLEDGANPYEGGLISESIVADGEPMPDGYDYWLYLPGRETYMRLVKPGETIYFIAQWED